MFCAGNRQTRGGSRIYDGALFDNIISGNHYLIDKTAQTWMMSESQTCLSSLSMIKEDKNAEGSRISHTGVSSFFSRCEQYDLLLPLLRNCCSLIDPFVQLRFFKVLFESISLFWNILINCKDVQSPEIFHFET